VLYELLAGSPPFMADSVPALIACIMSDSPRSVRDFRADLPEALAAIVMRCLEKDRAARFNDVGELAAALSPFAPHRSMAVVERAARILGSIPPPPQSRSSVPAPSVAREALSLPQGTAPGWAGNHGGTLESRSTGRRNGWLPIALGAVVAIVALLGYAVRGQRAEPIAVEPREPVSATKSVVPSLPTGPAPAPERAPVAEPVVSVPASLPSASAPRSEPLRASVSEKKPQAVAAAAPSAVATASAENKPKSSLKMSIKR
jgi:serine/threonine-protein kinase